MKRSGQSGFTLIIVVMLIAVLAVSALALLGLVQTELSMVGDSRRNTIARELAEGGTMEVINDTETVFPSVGDISELSKTYAPSDARTSRFGAEAVGASPSNAGGFSSSISMIRIAPMPESSHGLVRAVLNEVRTRGQVNAGAMSSDVVTEVYRPTSWDSARKIPRNHHH